MEHEKVLSMLKRLSGDVGEVCDFMYDNDNKNFSAKLRVKCAENEETQYYSDWSKDWIEKFSNETTTNWIVRYTYPSAKKYIYRKIFKCQHNNFGKVKVRKVRKRDDTRIRDMQCEASISIRVKKRNRNTIKNDFYLKKNLNVLIEINFHHVHKVDVAEAYSYLRISTDTEAIFCKYFNDGMTPAAARTFHEMCLENEHDEKEITLILANTQINPTERQIKHLHTKWRRATENNKSVEASKCTTSIENRFESNSLPLSVFNNTSMLGPTIEQELIQHEVFAHVPLQASINMHFPTIKQENESLSEHLRCPENRVESTTECINENLYENLPDLTIKDEELTNVPQQGVIKQEIVNLPESPSPENPLEPMCIVSITESTNENVSTNLPAPMEEEKVPREDDQYDVFGKFVASELRTTKSEATRKKMKFMILNILMDTSD